MASEEDNIRKEYIWKSLVVCLKILFQYLPVGTEQHYKILQSAQYVTRLRGTITMTCLVFNDSFSTS
jgi:hypothetical protein